MMMVPVGDNQILCVIEPGNIRRLKEGKPWHLKLSNGSEWVIAFTPDMASFVRELGLDPSFANPSIGTVNQRNAEITTEKFDQALKDCIHLPEIER